MDKQPSWPTVVQAIKQSGKTFREIAAECGFAGASSVHDLWSGQSLTCSYERGVKLMAMYAKAIKRKGRAT